MGTEILVDLARRINAEHSACIKDARNAVHRAIEVGRLLCEARDGAKYGQWYPWIEKNLEFGPFQASKYMIAFKNRAVIEDQIASATSDFKGIESVWKAIAGSKSIEEDEQPVLPFDPPEEANPAPVSRRNGPPPPTPPSPPSSLPLPGQMSFLDEDEDSESSFFCSECALEFSEEVWHCPGCAHHWPLDRVDCHNCYEYERLEDGTVREIDQYEEDDDEQGKDDREEEAELEEEPTEAARITTPDPSPPPDPEAERLRRAQANWSKILGDYCILIRSFQKAGGVKVLMEKWGRDRVELAEEAMGAAAAAFLELQKEIQEMMS